MARLDKSQGITFVYTNIYELYKKAKQVAQEEQGPVVVSQGKILTGEEAKKVQTIDWKKANRNHIVPMGVQEAERKAMEQKGQNPFNRLKKDLKELAKAHAKLRYLLAELENMTRKS